MPDLDQFLKLERFEVKVERVPDEPNMARVILSGRIDTPNPSAEIGVFLASLDAHFSDGITKVIVDASNLQYINSSGIKMMADWIVRVKENDAYILIFRLNKNLAWHSELLAPLRHLAPEKVLIEFAPE